MQNKYFIGYAKESFDGTPLSYGVDFCDEAPEDHIVDVSDPNLYIDVHITGRLDDEIALAQLAEFLREHNLSANCLNQSREQTFASEESINAAFEDTAAATETGFKDAVKNVFTKQAVRQSENVLQNLKSKWNANTELLQLCIDRQQFKKSLLTDVEAGRYFAASVNDPLVTELYVCYQTQGKKGGGNRMYGAVAQEMKPEYQGTKLEEQAIVRIVKGIRGFCKPDEIAGYTLDKKTAERWKTSFAEPGVSDEPAEGENVELDGGSSSMTQFEESWASAKDPLSRIKLLVRYLGDKKDRIDDDVIRGLGMKKDLKNDWGWKALQYVLKDMNMKFISSVYKALESNTDLRKEFIGREPLFAGLDFGNPTQFAVVKEALKTEAIKLLYDTEKQTWRSIEEMKKIYKEQNKFVNAKPIGAAASTAARNTQSVSRLAGSLQNLKPEQITQLMQTLADTKEGQAVLQQLLKNMGGSGGGNGR